MYIVRPLKGNTGIVASWNVMMCLFGLFILKHISSLLFIFCIIDIHINKWHTFEKNLQISYFFFFVTFVGMQKCRK